MSGEKSICEGQILTGAPFSEPMRVETVRADGPDAWVAGLVGPHSEQLRRVTPTMEDISGLAQIRAKIIVAHGQARPLERTRRG